MQRQRAEQLINDTLLHAFDETRFAQFAAEIFNGQLVTADGKSSSHQGGQMPDNVLQYKWLGQYEDPDGDLIDVLVVYLRRATSLERARTMQRNFAAHHLSQGSADNALIAYVVRPSADEMAMPDWRFSLVQREERISLKDDRLVRSEKLTPVRRFSFLVGENEPNHTARQQLLPLLLDSDNDPTLASLVDAFDIESVTKEFFEQYKSHVLNLKDAIEVVVANDDAVRAEFTRCDIDTANFAKKLLGQIVFLYFLQKKGWLAVDQHARWGDGARDFMRRLYQGDYGHYDNFFDQMLEPLFYEALAVDRTGQEDEYAALGVRIPFLNGGLFEPMNGYDWRATHLRLDDAVFGEVFDTLDLYNFTVREDEPLDKEVAIDPEMLGKVFENLLEVTDRKSKGAFYTPREIVHYMCQESLINYLATAVGDEVGRDDLAVFIREGEAQVSYEAARAIDDALMNVRICDPAIGSGAFPVGMMQEIVRARETLTSYLLEKSSRTAYNFKRHAIQNSIYGVDIDAGAIDIAKLRLWLSLVVDEEEYQRIQPLPNLDYKIVCGNSLLSYSWERQGLEELEELKTLFFEETDYDAKLRLRQKINAILIDVYKDTPKSLGYQVTVDFRINFSEVFKEKGGFDVVIGNPPYVRHEKIRAFKDAFSKRFVEVYTGTADLYTYFYAQGFGILREGGVLTYITPNKFMRAGYGKKLRGYLARETRLHTLIDFGDLPVFDATTYPFILVGSKVRDAFREEVEDNRIRVLEIRSLDDISTLHQAVDRAYSLPQSTLGSAGWQLSPPEVRHLMDKLKAAGTPLGQYVDGNIYRGITTGLNEAFVIDQQTRDELIAADPASAEVIKPYLRGRDVKRWYVQSANLFIIAVPRDGDIKNYVAVKSHLERYETKLNKRAGSQDWHQHQGMMASFDKFEYEKIISARFMESPLFAIDRNSHFTNDACYVISGGVYILSLLNSQIIWFYISQIASLMQGRYYQIHVQYLENIPIPDAPDALRQQIAELARQCLDAAQDAPDRLPALEARLNTLVYQAYGLTADEIALVEGV